jgi:uncharacterized protein
MRKFLLTGLLLGLTACSSQAADGGEAAVAPMGSVTGAVHAESGLRLVDLTVTHAGQKHKFRTEVAASAAEQEKGLMFRTHLGADEGMIFPMTPPRRASFWMKNTVISLDLIFVGPDGRILNIAAKAIPYDETNLVSNGPVKAVFEINGGRVAELGIAPGDLVGW